MRTTWNWAVIGFMAALALVPMTSDAPRSPAPKIFLAGNSADPYDDWHPPRGGEMDCSDFHPQDEAQATFEATSTGERPQDSDGITCERLR